MNQHSRRGEDYCSLFVITHCDAIIINVVMAYQGLVTTDSGGWAEDKREILVVCWRGNFNADWENKAWCYLMHHRHGINNFRFNYTKWSILCGRFIRWNDE